VKIDNSGAKLWHFCPNAYRLRYIRGLELDWEKLQGYPPAKGFGTRMHELLEEHYKGVQMFGVHPPSASEVVEVEAQTTFAAYKGFWLEEPWEVLAVERTFELPLGRHIYAGKLDLVVRSVEGWLGLVDHKTERRNSYRNRPEAWAARYQPALYKWAAEQLYGEPVRQIIVNVITRQSEKGQMPPAFRRDGLERSEEQVQEALANMEWTAEQIERCLAEFGPERMWPADRENCMQGNFRCEYYSIDVTAGGKETEEILRMYRPAEAYLRDEV